MLYYCIARLQPVAGLIYTKTDTRLMVSFQDNLGKLAPERLNQSGF